MPSVRSGRVPALPRQPSVSRPHARSGVRPHPFEHDRLDSLHSYGVLDTGAEPAYDDLAALAAEVCAAPAANVSLVDGDRQWCKAQYPPVSGLPVEVPRSWSFCSDAVAAAAPLVVPDATRHPRYRGNPLVTGPVGLRSYAGVPMVGRDGLPLGALCVTDVRPRHWTERHLGALTSLAGQAVTLMEERRRDLWAGLWEEWVPPDARLPGRLRQALDAGELRPYYQPMVDIDDGRVLGLEALLRWEHPRLGTLPPAAFMPGVEASALVVPVGRAVLDAALAEVAALAAAGIALERSVAVNVAGGQLARPGLSADVFAALDRHKVAPERLALEITETTALPDPGLARTELCRLDDAGVHIVLDDFGVGWSNLSRLLELPVRALKLDRSIAGAVVRDPRAARIVALSVRAAAEFGVDVVAEGVETEDVRLRLCAAGVQWAQGWLFGAPVPAASLPRLLAATPT